MAVSLNSVASFNPLLQAVITKRTCIRSLPLKIPVRKNVSTPHTAEMKPSRFHLSAANGENATAETADKNPPNEETAPSSTDGQVPNSASESAGKPSSKKASLTARERLRAARVLSRYTESKAVTSKPELNSKLLEALKESDKGKRRPSLPEAPTNLFDDSKRGMPKEGWTINLSAGMDVFFIAFSFVFISTVMFATTYLVWKVGAIHFNEY